MSNVEDPQSLLSGLQAALAAGNANAAWEYREQLRKAGVDVSGISMPGDDNSYTNPHGYAGDHRYYQVDPISGPKKPVAGENQRGEGATAAARDAAQRQYNRPLDVQKAIAEEQRKYNAGVPMHSAGTGTHPLRR
tara:strand:- start:268 stop:672 length:405 start_codon:yes stop_codon:yes gene_type:complete